jgi:Fe-Mn family superoxide dismutase
MNNRREFFKKAGLFGLAGIATKLISNEQLVALDAIANASLESGSFSMPKLPYSYNALEPFIDSQTMEIHYSKHHQGYVNKLNELKSTAINFSISDAEKCKLIDATTIPAIRNNLGGHYNHSLFWTLLKPNPEGKENLPLGKLTDAIIRDFKSIEEFKKQFSEKALKVFGSGWCWLIEQNGKLLITSTPNQDNPLMKVAEQQGKIVLGLDVWEHAYYLKHQNKRIDYIAAWWNLVNWETANTNFSI